MTVWMVTYYKDYSETLLGIFSNKEEALDLIEEHSKMRPKFGNEDYWSPIDDGQWSKIITGGEEPDVGTYRLIEVAINSPVNITLYAE